MKIDLDIANLIFMFFIFRIFLSYEGLRPQIEVSNNLR